MNYSSRFTKSVLLSRGGSQCLHPHPQCLSQRRAMTPPSVSPELTYEDAVNRGTLYLSLSSDPQANYLSSSSWDLILPPSKGKFQGPHANHGVSAEQKRIRDNLLSKSRLKKVIEIVQLVSLTIGNVLPAVSVWRHRDLPVSMRSKWLTVAFFEI